MTIALFLAQWHVPGGSPSLDDVFWVEVDRVRRRVYEPVFPINRRVKNTEDPRYPRNRRLRGSIQVLGCKH